MIGPCTPSKDSGVLSVLTRSGLKKAVEAALPAYLPQQRWFGGKTKTISRVEISVLASFEDGGYALTVIQVLYHDAEPEMYQLPLGIAHGDEADVLRETFPKAGILSVPRDESDELLYDASVSAGFQRALLSLFSHKSASSLGVTTSTSFSRDAIEQLTPRLGSAEQSNTSIFIGDKAILKLFRKLQPGENPEVEMTRFLSESAGFKNVPAFLGEVHANAPSATLAVMQAYAPNHGDGWEWYAEELRKLFSPASVSRGDYGPGSPARDSSSSPSVLAARLLGARTAEMHLALATPTDDPAFAAEVVSAESLAMEEERIEGQARKTLRALSENLYRLPEDSQAAAQALLDRQDALLQRCRFVTPHSVQSYGKRIRIHGDYHLGQTLRIEGDFLIVDFEGEPALPLAQRRRKQSSLKDVAGMLRSFGYAAQSALSALGPDTQHAFGPLAHEWETAVTKSFVEGYRDTIPTTAELLPSKPESEAWLQALLLEKAMYELLYELNNRPSWAHIPIHGLLALSAG